MHEIHELKEMLVKELEEYGRKGEMSAGSLEIVDKLAHAVKNLGKIIEMDEEAEYSGAGGSYNYGYRDRIVWVNSEQDAQNYPVAPNNAVALWDVSNPVIYLKQADSSGRPILKIYDIVERQRAPQKPSVAQEVNYKDFAEKREIEALRADIDDIRSKIEKMSAEKANGGVESVS